MASCVKSFYEIIMSLNQVPYTTRPWVYTKYSVRSEAERAQLICCIINAQFVNLGQTAFQAKYVCIDPADWRKHNPSVAQYCESSIPGKCVSALDGAGLKTVVPPSWRT